MPEADLYQPIKAFLEARGYEVKGEVGGCDLLAVRGAEPPIVVELKQRLTLALVLQAVDRLAVTESVYVAFRAGDSRASRRAVRSRRVHGLLRRLGLGLLAVTGKGEVRAVLDPAPYRPRRNARRLARLLDEFGRRSGDTETGGSPSRPRLTAYRQDALRCAERLAAAAASGLLVQQVRDLTGIQRAGDILRKDHYGWFRRIERGRYALTQRGHRELGRWAGRRDDAR